MTLREKKDLFHEWTRLFIMVNEIEDNPVGVVDYVVAFGRAFPEWVKEINVDDEE